MNAEKDEIKAKSLKNFKGLETYPKGNLAGLYCFFYKKKQGDEPACFYIGISASDVRGRIRTHLGKDVEKNYRKAFKQLENVYELSICYALIQEREVDKLKLKLEILESCLTVMLRPHFLTFAASVNEKTN